MSTCGTSITGLLIEKLSTSKLPAIEASPPSSSESSITSKLFNVNVTEKSSTSKSDLGLNLDSPSSERHIRKRQSVTKISEDAMNESDVSNDNSKDIQYKEESNAKFCKLFLLFLRSLRMMN